MNESFGKSPDKGPNFPPAESLIEEEREERKEEVGEGGEKGEAGEKERVPKKEVEATKAKGRIVIEEGSEGEERMEERISEKEVKEIINEIQNRMSIIKKEKDADPGAIEFRIGDVAGKPTTEELIDRLPEKEREEWEGEWSRFLDKEYERYINSLIKYTKEKKTTLTPVIEEGPFKGLGGTDFTHKFIDILEGLPISEEKRDAYWREFDKLRQIAGMTPPKERSKMEKKKFKMQERGLKTREKELKMGEKWMKEMEGLNRKIEHLIEKTEENTENQNERLKKITKNMETLVDKTTKKLRKEMEGALKEMEGDNKEALNKKVEEIRGAIKKQMKETIGGIIEKL